MGGRKVILYLEEYYIISEQKLYNIWTKIISYSSGYYIINRVPLRSHGAASQGGAAEQLIPQLGAGEGRAREAPYEGATCKAARRARTHDNDVSLWRILGR